MSITRPYRRMWRPLKGYSYLSKFWSSDEPVTSLDYLRSDVFVNQLEMRSLITTARVIIYDLYRLFNYIEPDDNNLMTFSHRIYELFLRATTEVESNMKAVLDANLYRNRNFTMNSDYFKLSAPLKLSEYRVRFKRWSSNREFKPFEAWDSGAYVPLPWYQAYNNVKHNRYEYFREANIENLMNAIAGLLSLLYAQFGEEMSIAAFEGVAVLQEDQNKMITDSFEIYAPSFSDEEQYDFIWDVLKEENNPVLSYNF